MRKFLVGEKPQEEPVNMFYKNSDVFNGVVNSAGYKVGDGKFSVFGHGAPGYLINLNSNTSIHNAKEFDQVMSMLNSNWNAAKDKNGTVLSLWSCESATPINMVTP